MKICLLALLLLTVGIKGNACAQQSITQEQCQQADAQLNQVYQQFRGILNDTQKEQRKFDGNNWKQLDK